MRLTDVMSLIAQARVDTQLYTCVKLDCAILALPVAEDPFSTFALFDEEFVLAVPFKHRLAQRKKIHAKDLVDDLNERNDRDLVEIGGLITTVRQLRSKKNNELMAFLTLEDLVGKSVAVTVFPRAFKDFGHHVEKDKIVNKGYARIFGRQ